MGEILTQRAQLVAGGGDLLLQLGVLFFCAQQPGAGHFEGLGKALFAVLELDEIRELGLDFFGQGRFGGERLE